LFLIRPQHPHRIARENPLVSGPQVGASALSDPSARLRVDARGRDDGVREELAEGVIEHLAEITAVDPAAAGGAPDEMLGLVLRRTADMLA
jgi:hypothetical protein